ncbi:MAG: 6-phosphogluconolactonase [Sulfuricella sp.]|nr:6-phosphogluconolactonase [Sulfuricella sp.]
MTPPQLCRWYLFSSEQSLQTEAVNMIARAAEQAIIDSGAFRVVLAGGSTPRALYKRLCALKTDWAAWHIYFGDERCLPAIDPGRNSTMARDAWLDHVPVPQKQVYAIPAEMGAKAAAAAYSATLKPVGEFDLVLLGLGEDGHTASLFPGNDWGQEVDSPVALPVFDAPKTPAERVSLSAWRLSQAKQVLFLVIGESKHEAVMNWRAGANIPARAIKPQHGVDVLAESVLLKE